MKKILSVWLIFIFSTACLPYIAPQTEKTHSEFTPEGDKIIPPPSQSETECFSSRGITSSPYESSTSFATLLVDEQSTWKLELPISDESNDDFNLEILTVHPIFSNKRKKNLLPLAWTI
jgi:hypothetical protein